MTNAFSINLLPWREAERKKRQRDFGIAMGGAVVAGIAVIMLTMLFYSSQMISAQESRNNRLKAEIAILEESIKEIDSLERQKERLLARMEIIEQLQKSRPEIVHLFDELVRQLPEGVYLTGMKQTGSRVELRGIAQSSTRVSALMRADRCLDLVDDPEVERVETKQSGTSRQSEFVVYAKQVRSDADLEDDV